MKDRVEAAKPRIPIEDLWLTLDGGRVRFQRAGTGPALLLVHGLLGYAFSWRHTIPGLAEQFTVYAPDLPGAGFSDPPPDMDCCLEACARRLLRFMEASSLKECALLGTSHGGAVAMMAAAQVPERIRSLILVAPVNPWSAHGRVMATLLTNALVRPVFVGLAPRLRILEELYFRRLYGDSRRIRPGTLEGYLKPLHRPGALQYGLSVLRSWNQDLKLVRSRLPRIAQIPALLLWGSRDGAVDPRSAMQLRQQFKDCRLQMMEGIGHLPYEEAPEEFNQAIVEFLGRS